MMLISDHVRRRRRRRQRRRRRRRRRGCFERRCLLITDDADLVEISSAFNRFP